MRFEETVEGIGKAVEGVGIGVVVLGLSIATARYLSSARRATGEACYRQYRRDVGKAILLGLEFLVAGDIIRTVAVDPTFTEVGVLAAVVAIRTFLSFSLEVELEGRWPWQSARNAGTTGSEH